jgi:hypothetical protein
MMRQRMETIAESFCNHLDNVFLPETSLLALMIGKNVPAALILAKP